MKPVTHTMHTMKQVYSTVVELPMRSYSLTKKQKRIITVYSCACLTEEVIYREIGNPGLAVTEYTTPVIPNTI